MPGIGDALKGGPPQSIAERGRVTGRLFFSFFLLFRGLASPHNPSGACGFAGLRFLVAQAFPGFFFSLVRLGVDLARDSKK